MDSFDMERILADIESLVSSKKIISNDEFNEKYKKLFFEAVDGVKNLKQKLEKMGKELQKRIDEETHHINHPKQIYRSVKHNCEYNLRVCEILKEILEEKE